MLSDYSHIILFDGVCSLCNMAVRFILKRDRKSVYKFASLQSEFGKYLLKQYHLPSDHIHSIILVEKGRIYDKSTAVLRIFPRLKGLWPLMYAGFIIPLPLRNMIYDFIAKNRYKWFGKTNTCIIPDKNSSNSFTKIP